MKNLTIRQVNSRNLKFMENIKTNQDLLKRIQCAINPTYNDIYVLLDEHLCLISSKRKFLDIDNPEYSLSKIVSMDYCVALQELYCAYESGCLAKIDMMDETRIDYNMVLSDINLQCMKFSPDHEIIAAVTTAGVVITMVLNFQVMSEVIFDFENLSGFICHFYLFDVPIILSKVLIFRLSYPMWILDKLSYVDSLLVSLHL